MKNHKQFCGLAISLDYIGDRWTLLLVRELLTGPKRFSELQAILKDCSPRLLSARMVDMQKKGLLMQTETTTGRSFYQLSSLGESLRPVVESLIIWGGQLIPQTKGLNNKQIHWLEIAVPALLRKRWDQKTPIKFQLEIENTTLSFDLQDGKISVIKNPIKNPNFILKTSYEKALALFSNQLPKSAFGKSEHQFSKLFTN